MTVSLSLSVCPSNVALDLLAKTAKKHHSLHGVALLRSDWEPELEQGLIQDLRKRGDN